MRKIQTTEKENEMTPLENLLSMIGVMLRNADMNNLDLDLAHDDKKRVLRFDYLRLREAKAAYDRSVAA